VTSIARHNGLSAYEAVVGRRSVRRFLPAPVDDTLTDSILRAAARAPSGLNSQPWLVHIVTGDARERLSRAVRSAAERGEDCLEYRYIPEAMKEPYLSRRRKLGFDLYALYGIDRHDIQSRKHAYLRNYDFFGAPVGLFITMERELLAGSWIDCGMFMQNIMTVARAFDLETCPQQAWCDYGPTVHRELGIPDEHILLSGIALGYPDPSAPENALISERVGPEIFAIRHT
jgi:nitroreductase